MTTVRWPMSGRRAIFASLAAAALCVSCLGPAPTDNTGVTPTNTVKLTALIDGTRWQPYSARFGVNQYGGFELNGLDVLSSAAFNVTISVGHVTGLGTYPLTGGVGQFEGGEALMRSAFSSAFWSTSMNGSSGTLTVTTATADRVAGTFQFSAPPTAGFGGTRAVTQGEFDFPITGSGFEFTPLNAAYRFSAQLDGTSCVPRNLVAFNVTPGDRLSLTVSCSDNRTIGLDVSAFTGVGAYALGSGTLRMMSFQRFTPTFASQMYGNSNALSAGTVDITSYVVGTGVGTTRVVGTFTATLQPTTAGAGTVPVQLSGAFDVRR